MDILHGNSYPFAGPKLLLTSCNGVKRPGAPGSMTMAPRLGYLLASIRFCRDRLGVVAVAAGTRVAVVIIVVVLIVR